MPDAHVVIVGAGPTGLMLANELRLAGVRPLVWSGSRDAGTPPRPVVSAGRSCNCCVTEACWNDSKQAELLRPARPVLLDLADRTDLRETARDWWQRVDIHTAKADQRPTDTLLIRPDGYIAWAAAIDEPADTASRALVWDLPVPHRQWTKRLHLPPRGRSEGTEAGGR